MPSPSTTVGAARLVGAPSPSTVPGKAGLVGFPSPSAAPGTAGSPGVAGTACLTGSPGSGVVVCVGAKREALPEDLLLSAVIKGRLRKNSFNSMSDNWAISSLLSNDVKRSAVLVRKGTPVNPPPSTNNTLGCKSSELVTAS